MTSTNTRVPTAMAMASMQKCHYCIAAGHTTQYVPGFLLQIKLISATAFPEWIAHLYNYAWFVGFLVSGTGVSFLL